MTFTVNEDTRLIDPATLLDDDRARDGVEDLEAGDKVTVHFRRGDTPMERIAVSVRVHHAEALGRQAAAQPRTGQLPIAAAAQQPARTEQQPREDRVEGQVVQASRDELRLRTQDGRTMTFKVDENTRVMDPAARYDDATARERVDALRAGESVAVRFRMGDTPDERIAMAIELRGTDAAATAERAVQPTTEPRGELPRTSSNLPLLAVLGIVGIIGATGVATWGRKRAHFTR
jgi:LPXTG-motif cell wall-anchored protein